MAAQRVPTPCSWTHFLWHGCFEWKRKWDFWQSWYNVFWKNLEIMLQWFFQVNFCKHWTWKRRTKTPMRTGSFKFGGLLGLQTSSWTCQSRAIRPNFNPFCHRSSWTALESRWNSHARNAWPIGLKPWSTGWGDRFSSEVKKVNLWQHWNLELQKFCRVRRILVWKEMLQSISYSDMGVVDELCAGSKLTGQTELTNLWPSKVTQATMTEGELHSQAKLQRNDLSYGQVVFFDPEIAHSVWDQTLQEVARGEAEGPFWPEWGAIAFST